MLVQNQQTYTSANDGQSVSYSSSLTATRLIFIESQLPFSDMLPSFEDGNLILYADGLAIRVHAGLVASKSHRLARQLAQPGVDLGIGVRAIEIRRGSDLSLLLEGLYHVNPLRYL